MENHLFLQQSQHGRCARTVWVEERKVGGHERQKSKMCVTNLSTVLPWFPLGRIGDTGTVLQDLTISGIFIAMGM